MSNIQFCHDRERKSDRRSKQFPDYFINELNPKGGRTIAVEVPTNEEFAVLSPSLKMPVPLKIGIAVCSKKDLYCKATGRQYALFRLKEYKFFVVTETPPSVPGEPRILELHNSELNLTIKLTKHPEARRVYFEGVV